MAGRVKDEPCEGLFGLPEPDILTARYVSFKKNGEAGRDWTRRNRIGWNKTGCERELQRSLGIGKSQGTGNWKGKRTGIERNGGGGDIGVKVSGRGIQGEREV
jgi:hypothetical protein